MGEAIVLAGGEGSRLRPLTSHRPKPMLPAATKPILTHVFDELIAAGIADITVVVGYGNERVKSYFGPTYRNVPIHFVTQRNQLGSGHALLAAEQAVDEQSLVVYGDQIVDHEIIEDVLDEHTGTATLGLLRRGDVSGYGGVLLNGTERVTAIVERPMDDRDYLLNAGVYMLDAEAFDAIRSVDVHPGEQQLIDGLSSLIETDDAVTGVVSEGLWVDATFPWDLLSVAETIIDSTLDGETTVADTALVHETATIVDPVVIGDDCVIGPGSVVGPYSSLGENVTVEANAVVRHSVVDADTRIGPTVSLVDCVTGRGVTIGPGSTVVGGPGDVPIGDTIYRDKRLGAVLADRVRDGGGVTYAPGSVVESDAVLRPGTTVSGRIAEGSEVRT